MTRDRLQEKNMDTKIPTVAQVMEGLQGLQAKLAFVRRFSNELYVQDKGLLLILLEIIDSLELAANDMDVITELATSTKITT